MIEVATYQLHIEFWRPLLGTQMLEGLPEATGAEYDEVLADAKRTTYFYRDTRGAPVLLDYHIMGFLKEAATALNGRAGGNGRSGGVKNLRSRVENLVSVSPVQIPLLLPPGGEIGTYERPCRRRTPYGPRVFIASSETIPERTTADCGLTVYPGDITQKVLEDLLDWGFDHGLGQWRTGGWGRFRYTLKAE